MKYFKLVVFAGFLLIIFAACKKKETSDFTNKLTIGTSINYNNFTLGGEGTSFSVTPGNVAYRLESAEDFNGNAIKFVILKDGIASPPNIISNNTGHIFMTTFNYGQRGSYSVSAYIVKASGDQVVASGTFQMN